MIEPCCAHPENHVQVRRPLRSEFVMICLAVMVTAATVALGYYFDSFTLPIDIPLRGERVVTIALPLFLLVFLVFIARPVACVVDSRYELCCHHLRAISGISSLRRAEVDVSYSDLKGVRFSQTLLERLLGIGTVSAWTAVSETPEFVLTGVRHPDRIARLLRERIDATGQDKNAVSSSR